MAQQFVNGELVDDGQEDQTANPMAGLQSTATPSRQGGFTPQASAYETPDWQSKVNTMGLNPNWDTLKKAGQAYNINPEDWSKGFQYYNDNITPFAGNSQWWGQDAMTRAAMQGYAGANPTANFNWQQYTNPSQETSQQKFKADEQMALQNKGGDDLFGSLLPLLLVGGLGLATGGFGFGAAGAAGAGATEAGLYGAAGLGASSPVWSAPTLAGSLAADNAVMAGFGSGVFGSGSSAGDWAGDFGGGGENLPTGSGGVDPTVSYYGGGSDPGLYDLFNQGGLDFEGAASYANPSGPSATNLEQALNVPNQQTIPNVDVSQTADKFTGYNPETGSSIDQVASAGLDTPAPIREASVNASIPDQARLGLKGLNQMTQSPYFQIQKTLYNLYSQDQKARQLESMMNKFQQQSDVGGPFRDMMMRSFNDPNFFKNMPEFGAGMEAFNQQYGANAAAKGGRSQLGGAAHNIAVNREGSRLADIYRSRLAPLAGMQPNMQGMAALAPAVANAQGNQFNSLFDPQLWNSLKDFF